MKAISDLNVSALVQDKDTLLCSLLIYATMFSQT